MDAVTEGLLVGEPELGRGCPGGQVGHPQLVNFTPSQPPPRPALHGQSSASRRRQRNVGEARSAGQPAILSRERQEQPSEDRSASQHGSASWRITHITHIAGGLHPPSSSSASQLVAHRLGHWCSPSTCRC